MMRMMVAGVIMALLSRNFMIFLAVTYDPSTQYLSPAHPSMKQGISASSSAQVVILQEKRQLEAPQRKQTIANQQTAAANTIPEINKQVPVGDHAVIRDKPKQHTQDVTEQRKLPATTNNHHQHEQQQQQQQQAPPPKRQPPPPKLDTSSANELYFVPPKDISTQDTFSASWLQSKKEFLTFDLAQVGMCEDAAFKLWNEGSGRRHKLRMTLDYFDFSVEHLSLWFKRLNFATEPIVYDSIMTKLNHYLSLAERIPDPIFGETLSTIPFQEYKANPIYAEQGNPLPAERAYNLTITCLAATLESLRRAQMGRVVVVGSQESHVSYANAAFQYLHDHLPQLSYHGGDPNHDNSNSHTDSSKKDSTLSPKLGHMELDFVTITERQYKTNILSRNMPLGALVGAKEVMQLADVDPAKRTKHQQGLVNAWLGTRKDPTHWKYLYLTEPDSVLVTRDRSLQLLKDEIDIREGIISPWRLQPIPHESDIRGYHDPKLFLAEKDGFEQVLSLDHQGSAADGEYRTNDVCCDEDPAGKDFRPAKKMPDCGKGVKWFWCGFKAYEFNAPLPPDPHERLRNYELFRLTKGTGITTIAGNLFARRCDAQQHTSFCTPPKRK